MGRAPGTDPATAAAFVVITRPTTSSAAGAGALGLNDDFPDGAGTGGPPFRAGRRIQNRVPRPRPHRAVDSARPVSASLAGQSAGRRSRSSSVMPMWIRPCASASFRPSEVLAEPYSLVSVHVVADHDRSRPGGRRFGGHGDARMFMRRDTCFHRTRSSSTRHRAGTGDSRFLTERFSTVARSTSPTSSTGCMPGPGWTVLVVMGHSRRAQYRTLGSSLTYGLPGARQAPATAGTS